MAKIYESMTCGNTHFFTVRAWVTETKLRMGPRKEVLEAIHDHEDTLSPEVIALALDQIPGIAAYEIVDINRNGAVTYIDWP